MSMLKKIVRNVGEHLASCPPGQFVLLVAEKVLWTLETSATWFMRKEQRDGPLIRPLPWIFFLPLLLSLRCLKIVPTLISFVRGKETLPPIEVVSYIHFYRRRVRDVKYIGSLNFSKWRMMQEEKQAGGEYSVMRMFGIYWLLAFTGIGMIISPLKAKEPLADESDESDSDDTSGSSFDSSDDSSEESLETAEIGSESTSHTFYRSANITTEPIQLQASQSMEQALPVDKIPGTEHTQEQSGNVEKQTEESSSENENISEQEKTKDSSQSFQAAGNIKRVKSPSADNDLENVVQKDSEVQTQKISSDPIEEQSLSSESKEKCDDNQYSEGKNQFKELDEKLFEPNLEDDTAKELARLHASVEMIMSLANGTDISDANSDLINSEISIALPPFSKSDSVIENASSTLAVEEKSTEDIKPRRFSDFFIKKKKT